jgi:hypothetical protein
MVVIGLANLAGLLVTGTAGERAFDGFRVGTIGMVRPGKHHEAVVESRVHD